MILVDYYRDGEYGAWVVDDDSDGNTIDAVVPSVVRSDLSQAIKWAENVRGSDESVMLSEICHALAFDEWVC